MGPVKVCVSCHTVLPPQNLADSLEENFCSSAINTLAETVPTKICLECGLKHKPYHPLLS